MRLSSRHLLLFVVLTSGVVSAQTQAALPPFSSWGGGPFDSVNLGNLDVHFTIPVLHKAGRGMPFSYDISYDGLVWSPVTSSGITQWQPASAFGWSNISNAGAGGYINYSVTNSGGSCPINPPYTFGTYTQAEYYGFVYHDPAGFSHPIPYDTYYITQNSGCTSPQPGPQPTTPAPVMATDGSGYTMYATPSASSVSAYLVKRDGTVLYPLLTSGPPSGGSWSATDANGNMITESGGTWTDTLGTQVLAVVGTAPSNTTLTYVAPSGANASYTVSYTNYTVQTWFKATGITEYGPLSAPLVTSITLPDGSSYSLSYEPTPSAANCTPKPGTSSCVTGRIASITLPTGGAIAYTYSGGSNGIESDGTTAGLTRTLTPGGAWGYSRALSGSTWVTTVKDPNQDQTVINFSGSAQNFYETQRTVNQLIGGSQTLLTTSTNCYNAHYTNCATASVSLPITQIDSYSQLPNNSTRLSEVFYNGNELVTDDKEYDYGVTTGSAPGNTKLVSETVTTYSTLGPISDKPASVTVKDWSSGSGVTVASSTYSYDGPGTLTTTTGTPQHASISGWRGNLTTTATQTNSSTTLYRQFTYYDTGMPKSSTSVDTSSSTTCASKPTICTTYNYSSGTASCGNAFSTSISEPLSLSASFTWDCTGGVETSVTDESGQTSNIYYTGTNFSKTADPDFWRPYAQTDQLGTPTTLNYTTTAFESAMALNSNASVVDRRVDVDGFGRSIVSQTEQGYNSGNYDSVETDYDVTGMPSKMTIPYGGTAGSLCSGACPGTTTVYDALGRPTVVTDGGGGIVSNTYTQNDVLSALTPIPSGEYAKQTQTEYDGLGRVKSVCQIFHAGGGTSCSQATGAYSGIFDTYSYTSASYSTTVSVTRGSQTRSATYDALGRPTSITTPEGGTTTNVYDSYPAGTCGGHTSAPGHLMLTTFANGNNICYLYDDLGRLRASEGWNSSTGTCSRYVYDSSSNGFFTAPGTIANAGGRLVEAETDACSPYPPTTASMITDEWFSYDKDGRITDEWQKSTHSTQYYHSVATFFENGAVKTLQPASPSMQTITYGLDGEGRWNTLTKGTTPLVTGATFYPAANPEVISLAGSPADNDSYTIDQNTGRMTKYVFNVGSLSMTGNLTWNPSGTLKQLAITDGFNSGGTQTCDFNASLASPTGYDDLNRLVGVDCGSGQWGQTFGYTQYDNLTKTVITNRIGTTWNPGYSSSTNHYACSGCTTDASGNVTNDTNHVFGWDGAGYNKLTWSATSGTPTCGTSGNCITYDAFGRIVETSNGAAWTERWYNQTGGWASMSGTSLGFVYWPAPAGGTVIVGGGGSLLYMHKDWLGSARLTSNLTTHVYTADTAYSPYGEMYDTFGASDTEFDEFADITGNYSNGVMWDASYRELSIVGRWLSPDPAYSGWNQYAYPTNPNSFIDPLGLGKVVYINGCWYIMYDGEGAAPNEYVLFSCSNSPGLTGVGPENPGGGSGSGGGSGANKSLKQQICSKIPSGSTSGVSGGIGGVVAPGAGAELVFNYDSGQISAFVFEGAQVGWNGGASGSAYTGFVWGLNSSNSNYSGGFTGVNGGAGLGGFAAGSSQGMDSVGLNGIIPNPRGVVAAGVSLGTGVIPGPTGGVTLTDYSNPAQLGKYWGFGPVDWLLYAARQVCK